MSDELVPEIRGCTGLTQHNILIAIPRTASNLFTQVLALSSQPSIVPHARDGYFFLGALSHRFKNATFHRPYSGWSDLEKRNMDNVLQSDVSAWKAWVSDADAQGVGTYVKEHVNWTILPSVESSFLHPALVPSLLSSQSNDALENSKLSNPTAIPDAFWTRIRATFLIRHPALTFPSTLRTAIDNEGLETALGAENETVMRWECTFHWHVLLYNFLISQQDQLQRDVQIDEKLNEAKYAEPLIIDATQLQDSAFVRRYADAVGLDANRTRTQWKATSADEQSKLGKIERRMKDTLLDSTGIMQGKLMHQVIDLAEERKKWEKEFGDVLTGRLERLVRSAMAEYEWLFERRWRG